MGAILNQNVFKGVSVNGQIVKGLAKNGVAFWKYETPIPTDYILAYDFNGNTADKSVNGLNGVMTGTLAFEDGRKAGTQSLKFTNGCVKTVIPIPLNSNKVSVSFWMKTTQTASGVILEMSTNSNANNAFSSYINEARINRISIVDKQANYNRAFSSININTGNWFHIVLSIDRSLDGVLQNKIVVNNSILHSNDLTADNNGNFVNNILFVGQRGAISNPFNGNLQNLKIYNRILTPEEITALYNE